MCEPFLPRRADRVCGEVAQPGARQRDQHYLAGAGQEAPSPGVDGYAVAMPIFFFSSASASAPAPGEGVDRALSMSSSMVPPTSASWS